MFCGRLVDDLSHGDASGEEDHVKSLSEQGGGFRNRSLYNGKILPIEIVRNQFGNKCAAVDGEFTRLENNGATRRNRSYYWPQRKLVRIIPGTDNETHTPRVRNDVSLGWSVEPICIHMFDLSPFL